MYLNILLETEQEELLIKLVEAHRNTPDGENELFYYTDSDLPMIIHSGLPYGQMSAYIPDLLILYQNQLISLQPKTQTSGFFGILPLGFGYCDYIKSSAGSPVQNFESTVLEYLSAEPFKREFLDAYQKWTEAEALLRSRGSRRRLSTIGYLCKDAMRKFASVLTDRYSPPSQGATSEDPVERLRAVLNCRAAVLGKMDKTLFDALLPCWDSIADLVQGQECPEGTEGERFVWEDGRRLVFQTALIMFEIAWALRRCEHS